MRSKEVHWGVLAEADWGLQSVLCILRCASVCPPRPEDLDFLGGQPLKGPLPPTNRSEVLCNGPDWSRSSWGLCESEGGCRGWGGVSLRVLGRWLDQCWLHSKSGATWHLGSSKAGSKALTQPPADQGGSWQGGCGRPVLKPHFPAVPPFPHL